jgi:hypothetical protein
MRRGGVETLVRPTGILKMMGLARGSPPPYILKRVGLAVVFPSLGQRSKAPIGIFL